MFKKILLFIGIILFLSQSNASDLNGIQYFSNFSQKGAILGSSNSSMIGINIINPNLEKEYGWKLENTFGLLGVSKRQNFMDIGINIIVNGRKIILIDGDGKLSFGDFSKSRHIDYEKTMKISNSIFNKLADKNFSVGYYCDGDNKDADNNINCVGINNVAGFFKVAPYAIENGADGILNGGIIKRNGIRLGGIIDFDNKIIYGIYNGYLIKYQGKNKRTISAKPILTYSTKQNFDISGLISIDWNNENGQVAFYGNEKVGLYKIGLNDKGFIEAQELVTGKPAGLVAFFTKESVYQKDNKYYINFVSNGTLKNMDYTNARVINLQLTYGVAKEMNKAILTDGIVNTVKAKNLLSILSRINGFVSNQDARYVFGKPFGIYDIKLKSVNGIDYIEDMGLRNINDDDKLNIIWNDNVKQLLQAGLKYGAYRDGRIGYYKVGDVFYRIGQIVDNGQISYAQVDGTGALEKVYFYQDTKKINVPQDFAYINGALSNPNSPYLYTHGRLGKYKLVGSFENGDIGFDDIYTNRNVSNNINDNFTYSIINNKLTYFDESNSRYINLQKTYSATGLSGYNVNRITAVNTLGGDIYTLMLSGDNKLYANIYQPDNNSLLNNDWTQITSGSNNVKYLLSDYNKINLIDADGLYWVK